MLLTITSTLPPATDLGHLLGQHPAQAQTFDPGFGRAHVFYPEASEERCTAALLLDLGPVALEAQLERLPERQRARATLLEGALTHRDRRLAGYAAVVELIKHPRPPHLEAFEQALFACARPRAECRAWARGAAGRHGYAVRFLPVGPERPELGPPTQLVVFTHG